ncbi:MAG: hypothetical protein ABI721_05865 [Candidatus Dojkabacteria bacterium]
MKIYFTASTAEFNKYKKTYFKIRDFLVSENHILTRDWLDKTRTRIDNGMLEVFDIKEIYDACMKAIAESDIVIIEDTVSNFSTGHQITVALQRQKPTLVLWSKPKHRHFTNTFINGIDSDILEFYEYDESNIEEIIRRFTKKYENAKQKNRFHLVLSDVERRYLDWAQYNKDKSRTKIIRDSLRKYIDSDEEYKNYLERK